MGGGRGTPTLTLTCAIAERGATIAKAKKTAAITSFFIFFLHHISMPSNCPAGKLLTRICSGERSFAIPWIVYYQV
jgi:hypothetical protein